MTSDTGYGYVIGVDFGTLSAPAVAVAVADGRELGSAVHDYAHAVVVDALPDHPDVRLGPNWALQVPRDYLEAVQRTVPAAAACWLIGGGPHHTVLSTAVGTPELDAFAEMTRTELAVIDADTAPRRFRQELRWNQAYHKFSGPL